MQAQKIREVKDFGQSSETFVQLKLTEAEADRLIVYLGEMKSHQRRHTLPERIVNVSDSFLKALEDCV